MKPRFPKFWSYIEKDNIVWLCLTHLAITTIWCVNDVLYNILYCFYFTYTIALTDVNINIMYRHNSCAGAMSPVLSTRLILVRNSKNRHCRKIVKWYLRKESGQDKLYLMMKTLIQCSWIVNNIIVVVDDFRTSSTHCRARIPADVL